ncbi:MAG: hypothetical protein GY729_11380 [Desulfobacteraceae bacterium]|nr:hypothetical protein [Desulfobacteraceae bacterium]
MLEINSYSFGKMVINNVSVATDFMILPNGRIINNWRRQRGHLLQSSDIKSLIESQPDILVVGTGASGLMQVAQDLLHELETKGITTIIKPCSQAADKFNILVTTRKKVAACFHLAC